MYERLKLLYKLGKINKTMLDVAVTKGWIDKVQLKEILA